MNTYYAEIYCRARDIAIDPDELFDRVADALHEVSGVRDADLGADLSEREFHFCMYLDAPDSGEALLQALTATRTALHVSGGDTSSWNSMFQEVGHMVRLAEAA